jgi:DNA (cytosine-5)-methyltransferase 1
MKRNRKKERYPAISLFTGAFGLDLGLEKAGFSVKACVEKDKACVQTILANRPRLKDKIFNQDINQVSVSQLLKTAGLKRGEAILVSGGPPCQPFSTVGRRESISSDDGKLFSKFLEIVWGIYPKCFIFENVRGILSAAIQHKPLNMRDRKLKHKEILGSGWDFINKQFSEKLKKGKKGGYHFQVWELNAADYGVPQNRRRVFIVGSRDGVAPSIPKGNFKNNPRTVKDAIGHLNGNHEIPKVDYYQYEPIRRQIFEQNLVKAGQNWTVLPEHLQKKVMGNGWYATGGKVGFCRRLSWSKPSPTITTNPSGRATNMCHPRRPRPLNYIECALIQGFPKSWRFEGSLNQKYRQIGNAVPAPLARLIGKSIIVSLEK